MRRRTVLATLAGLPLLLRRSVWAAAKPEDYFIFVHAAGGWDVTLWSDPRNERKGLVEPASTDNTEVGPLARWKPARLDADTDTFEPLRAGQLVLGPAIGDLYDLHDRLTIVNGLAMATVSHPDGTAFSATGRHLQGGTAPASGRYRSVDARGVVRGALRDRASRPRHAHDAARRDRALRCRPRRARGLPPVTAGRKSGGEVE